MPTIPALTALTVPSADDILPIVDDPAGTAVVKKITLRELVPAGINGLLFKVLTADASGQNTTSGQPWFPSAGAVTVAATTTYFMEGLLLLTHGTTTHTTALSFLGTATLTSLDYLAEIHTGAANAIATGLSQIWVNVATSTVLNATAGTASTVVRIWGVVRVNAGGTLIPTFTFSAAPGTTVLVKRNTYVRLYPVGLNTVASQGTWT
jgi:hypothetical protein